MVNLTIVNKIFVTVTLGLHDSRKPLRGLNNIFSNMDDRQVTHNEADISPAETTWRRNTWEELQCRPFRYFSLCFNWI